MNWFEKQGFKIFWRKNVMNSGTVRRWLPLIAVAYIAVIIIAQALGFTEFAAAVRNVGSLVGIESHSPISPTEFAAAVAALSGVVLKVLRTFNLIKAAETAAKSAPGPIVLLLMLLPSMAFAQEPTPTPEPDSIRFSTGGTRFYTPGQGDETEMEGQLLGIVHVPGKLVAEGFGRYTRTQGTEAAAGGLDVKSFRSIIADLKLRRQVFSGWVRTWALCLAGVSWSRDKAFNPSDPNVWAVGCGAKLESVKGSFSSVIGHNGSVGGRAVFGQLTINQGERVRYVATYAIPFSAERFRTYPGAFTSGVQVDAWVKERQR